MGMSIDDLASIGRFGGGKGRREQVTFLPEPEPRDRRYTVISVDDHIVEPPDTFDGRVPAQVRRRGAARRRRPTTAARRGCGRASCCRTSASTPSSAGPSSEYSFEPTRFDEMRRGAWDIARPRRRHGPQRRVRVAVLPVVPARLRRPAAHAVADDDELALAAMRGVERLAPRGVGGRAPGPHHPVPDRRGCSTPRSRPTRSGATPTRGFKAVTFSEAPDKLGLPSLHTGYWDPLFAACEETEHRRVPARRLVGHVADDVAPTRRPRSSACCSSVRHVRRGRLAVLEDPGALPRPQDLPVRGRHRLGAGLLDRLDHCYTLPARRTARGTTSTQSPPEVLQRNFWFCAIDDPSAARCATASASTTSWSSPTTRTPTPPGPTPRRCSCASSRPGRPRRRRAPHHLAERSELFRHPVPSRVQR